jgi:eukaryotic-like serine/threonine-protein kinase
MTSGTSEASPSVLPGTLVGSYRIERRLAEGGMGVVYRAIDTRLERPVAIKFLSNELADAESRRRFQREAQLASSLNHPHILTVYDIGEFANRQYLVMELVEGGTLSEWAARERPSWRQIVGVLLGVADGLAAAHEAGILHRDVKPQNVLVAKNGYAKLADFGVAKLTAPVADPAAPTAVAALTRWGVVIGSPGYMSPEQTSGRALDARSDVFSFGVILYELLSGRRPFAGVSDIEIAQAVIHEPMPPLPLELPIALRMVVEKALEKDPADRYQTMRDLVVDLRRLARRQVGETGEQPASSPASAKRRHFRASPVAVMVALAAAALGGLGGWWLARAPQATVTPLNAFQRVTDFVGVEEMPAVSPDGRQVAFTAEVAGRRQILLHLLAGGSPLQITHAAADHEHPRWAPDSSSLIYFVPSEQDNGTGTLWEVPALGGAARRIAPSLGGADLSRDGRRIAAFQIEDGATVLAILGRDGSRVGPVIPLPQQVEYRTPRWSPDDRSIAFVANAGGFRHHIYLVDVEGGPPIVLTMANDVQGLTWLPDGSGLVYASSEGSTLSYPPVFNLRLLSRHGAERQLTVGDVSFVQPDMRQPGSLLASAVRMQSDIWGFPFSGAPTDNVDNAVRITRQTGMVQTPSVSPDGTEIAYLSDTGGHGNVWVSSMDGSNARQITFERDPAVLIGIPVWSPAGDWIVYIRTDASGSSEWLINPADGSDQRHLVDGVAANWSWDGRWLYFANAGIDEECIHKISVEGGSPLRVRCAAANPVISVDGATIYFSPSVTRQNELLKATPEDGPSQVLTSYAVSRIPAFPTGYALSPDGRWIAVPLKDGRTTNVWAISTDDGSFRQVTDFGDRPILITRQVSWSPDGEFIYAAVVESDADIVLFEGLSW